jgi:hypothetical protein
MDLYKIKVSMLIVLLHAGVMKSVMGELTDSTNRAEAFALLPITWGIGATMGYRYTAHHSSRVRTESFSLRPLLGGTLSRPHERFPGTFGGNFWKEYPYFLPCLVTASYVFFAFIITLFFREVSELFGPCCCRLTHTQPIH